jgi:hypothetical protein
VEPVPHDGLRATSSTDPFARRLPFPTSPVPPPARLGMVNPKRPSFRQICLAVKSALCCAVLRWKPPTDHDQPRHPTSSRLLSTPLPQPVDDIHNQNVLLKPCDSFGCEPNAKRFKVKQAQRCSCVAPSPWPVNRAICYPGVAFRSEGERWGSSFSVGAAAGWRGLAALDLRQPTFSPSLPHAPRPRSLPSAAPGRGDVPLWPPHAAPRRICGQKKTDYVEFWGGLRGGGADWQTCQSCSKITR